MSEAQVLEPTLDWAAVELARRRNQARALLLQSGQAVSLEMLARGRDSSAAAARQWVSRHRRNGHLVTVTQAGQVLVPTFQLDEGFGRDLAAASVVARLMGAGMDAWEIWDWVTHPNGWLDGRRPQDLLHEDPDAVTRAIDGLLQE
ncbi:MAG: hypothetical protein ABI239_01945 [Aquihabitans sp.]